MRNLVELMVWTNLYMEEAMLIIFLGTSMKSHSAAPMAAAAAAGWLAAGVPGSKAVDDDYSLQEVKRK